MFPKEVRGIYREFLPFNSSEEEKEAAYLGTHVRSIA
jgi:hypothetical protein